MNSTGKRTNFDLRKLVYLAILSALVVILQIISNITSASLPITLTLVPIVLGGALIDKWSGAWLGFVFGLTVLLSGSANAFFAISPLGTIVTVIVKGVLAGLLSALVYSLIEAKNRYLAILVAGVVAPVVNTAIFLLGCYVFFFGTEVSLGNDVLGAVVATFTGVNFLVELGLNMLLAPTILRLINIKKAN